MRLSRRHAIALGWTTLMASSPVARASQVARGWSLPIRNPNSIAGDGFMITRCFCCENIDKYPNWWHTAEDWRLEDDSETAGSEVLAVSAGEVVYAAYEYPGRVVIIAHEDGLYSVYGHLDPDLEVVVGQRVEPGEVIGRVFFWTDGRAPSHLHFEIRDFYTQGMINGDDPRYGVTCGYQCPPGPGYWPMADGRLPVELGWKNPTHVIGRGLAVTGVERVQVATTAGGMVLPVRKTPAEDAHIVRPITLVAGDTFAVLNVSHGRPESTEIGAMAYELHFEVETSVGESGWLRGVVADWRNVGPGNEPASVRPVLLPLVRA